MSEIAPTHLDLFSGIGGFSLASESVGFKTIGFSEIDPYASSILKKHWPNVPNFGDIRNVALEKVGSIDLITAGFPCQPFSVSGERRGDSDERFLWPELVRVLSEIRPSFALFENVPGLLSIDGGRTFNRIMSDVVSVGYDCIWNLVPACAVGANHRRDRLWIVANTIGERWDLLDESGEKCKEVDNESTFETKDDQSFLSVAVEGFFPGEVGDFKRNDDGLSEGVDRMRCLGNSIVPQVAQIFLKEIRKLICSATHPT